MRVMIVLLAVVFTGCVTGPPRYPMVEVDADSGVEWSMSITEYASKGYYERVSDVIEGEGSDEIHFVHPPAQHVNVRVIDSSGEVEIKLVEMRGGGPVESDRSTADGDLSGVPYWWRVLEEDDRIRIDAR